MTKCIECAGNGVVIFVEVNLNTGWFRRDVKICLACKGEGIRSFWQNWIWRRKHKEETSEGGACLVYHGDSPAICFGSVLNTRTEQKDHVTIVRQNNVTEESLQR